MILITDRAGRELAGWHIIRGRFGLPVLVDEAGRVCGPDQAERRRLTVYADDADALRLRRSGYDVGDMPIGRSREPAAAQRERIEP